MRPVITSKKHYVQSTLFTIGGTSIQNIVIVDAKADPTLANDVLEGSIVKACFVEIWIQGSANQPATFQVSIEKVPAGAGLMTNADSSILYTYFNKKNILFTSQGIVGDANSNPIPIIRGWYKIPKGKQRFGLGDRLVLNINNITIDDFEACGIYVYKEYN